MLAVVGSRQSCLTLGRAPEMDGDQMGGEEVDSHKTAKTQDI